MSELIQRVTRHLNEPPKRPWWEAKQDEFFHYPGDGGDHPPFCPLELWEQFTWPDRPHP